MEDKEQPALTGIAQARQVERADRDAEVADELDSVAKLADELSEQLPADPPQE